MSHARSVFKNTSMITTRRVRGREFLLRPSEQLNQLLLYVVAVKRKQYNLPLHAITALSNHWHQCLTDLMANVVDYERDCHSTITRALNCFHGEFESVWASEQGSRVTCVEPDDLIEKIGYTLANPVKAKLVRNGYHWPGVRMAWPAKPMTIERPKYFFFGEEDGGKWPKEVVLEFARPPGFDELSDEELAKLMTATTDRHEDAARTEADAEGWKFLGRKKILAQSRHARPGSREPRFGISPKVACRNKWRRIEKLQEDKEWRLLYDINRIAWLGGDREVEFPYGTYKMRVVHGAKCASAPA